MKSKRLVALVLVSLIVFSMAACSNSQISSLDQPPETLQEQNWCTGHTLALSADPSP